MLLHPAPAPRPLTADADPPPLLSIVVPVRNEGANIRPLIEEIAAALRGVDHEIVYVDDGSTDDTPARLRDARGAFPDVLVVRRHRASCGQSAAVVTGIRAARGTFVATLDGDGQNDPADIPALLARAQAADDPWLLVAGHRTQRRDTWVKRRTSRVANGVRAALLRDATPDTGCGLKLFRRAAFLELPCFDHMHRYLPALFIRAGGAGPVRARQPPPAHPRAQQLRHAGPAVGRPVRPCGRRLAATAMEAPAGRAAVIPPARPWRPRVPPVSWPVRAWLSRAWRPALLLLGLVGAGLALRRMGLDTRVAAAGEQGPLAYVLVGMLACTVGVPRQVVAYAGGLAFGFWPGTALALLAEALGCAADFFWARLLARRWALGWLRRRGGGRLERLDRHLCANAFTATLTLRLLPFSSNLVVNLLAGVSGVSAGPFLAASVLGYVPQTAVFALLGGGVRVSQGVQVALAAALFAASIGLGVLLLRRQPAPG